MENTDNANSEGSEISGGTSDDKSPYSGGSSEVSGETSEPYESSDDTESSVFSSTYMSPDS